MTKNPIYNALSALLYICIVASVMFYGIDHSKPGNSIIIPIAVLSLFTLSAAIMGYVFGFQPLQLYLDGKKKPAVDLFLKTLLSFGIITILAFILLFSGVI
jgi:hypothetical protein